MATCSIARVPEEAIKRLRNSVASGYNFGYNVTYEASQISQNYLIYHY
jgi:hypothetical protein